MPHSSGGGSHGGGGHSGGGSGGSGSGHRVSRSYFNGATRYAYYHKGRIDYYYRDAEYTEADKISQKKGIGFFFIVWYAFLIPIYTIAFISVFKDVFGKPEKLDMDYAKQDIVIEDRLGLIDDKDKERIETSFKNFQDITGITPALVLVDNSLWNANYTNLENYSYELYLQNFDDEKHWLIVYSEDGNAEEGAWKDWYWEGMQGDDTDSILTASKTDNFTKSLQDALLKDDEHFTDVFTAVFDGFTSVVMEKESDPMMQIFTPLFLLLHAFAMLGSPVLVINSTKKNTERAANSVKLENGVQYVEDTCRYCGGLYIHGLHLSCPHCGGALEPLGQPINVDSSLTDGNDSYYDEDGRKWTKM